MNKVSNGMVTMARKRVNEASKLIKFCLELSCDTCITLHSEDGDTAQNGKTKELRHSNSKVTY
jgi:hypothetical protein